MLSAHRRITDGLVIATRNLGKLHEMAKMLAAYSIQTISAAELDLPEPEETGETFAENARIKAMAAAIGRRLPAFADDSGLVVSALDGAPGIHSARWAGESKDFQRAMEMVEAMLRERNKGKGGDRRAYFISALCVAWPDGHLEEFEGRVGGTLVWPPRGTQGFGYDPMFVPDGHTRTFGEMSAEEKHGLPPPRRLAEWKLFSRFDSLQEERSDSWSDALPAPNFGEPAPTYALSHRARAFLKLAEACLGRR